MIFNEGKKINDMLSTFTFVGHKDNPSVPSEIVNKGKEIHMISNRGGLHRGPKCHREVNQRD